MESKVLLLERGTNWVPIFFILKIKETKEKEKRQNINLAFR